MFVYCACAVCTCVGVCVYICICVYMCMCVYVCQEKSKEGYLVIWRMRVSGFLDFSFFLGPADLSNPEDTEMTTVSACGLIITLVPSVSSLVNVNVLWPFE